LRVQHVLTVAKGQLEVTGAYIQYLPMLDVTKVTDCNTVDVILSDDDVGVQVKLDALQHRLRCVMMQQHSELFASEVKTIINQLRNLLFQSCTCT
jgi:hypothetical protein